jgi:phenylpyruvate tautomerase PptA (4-oxalocrotonate tautomerase family)
MPTYVCTVCGTDLTSGQKSQIAREITKAHSALTAAPHFFAQVFFQTPSRGDHFIGGALSETESVFVRGDIRAGRTAEIKRNLVTAIIEGVHRITGIPAGSIWVYLNELPSGQMAEFGRVLPEPGTEKEWLAALPASEGERIRRLGSAEAADEGSAPKA